MSEPNLAYRSGGLALLQPQRPLRQFQFPAAERDRTRGHENDLLIALTQAQKVSMRVSSQARLIRPVSRRRAARSRLSRQCAGLAAGVTGFRELERS